MPTNKTAAYLLLLGICIYNDIRLFTKPRENWRAAAATLKRMSDDKTCLIFAPASSESLYLVFDRTLAAHDCNDQTLQHDSRIALATSPYDTGTKTVLPAFTKDIRIGGDEPSVTIYRRK
jgi:hypothetical protein